MLRCRSAAAGCAESHASCCAGGATRPLTTSAARGGAGLLPVADYGAAPPRRHRRAAAAARRRAVADRRPRSRRSAAARGRHYATSCRHAAGGRSAGGRIRAADSDPEGDTGPGSASVLAGRCCTTSLLVAMAGFVGWWPVRFSHVVGPAGRCPAISGTPYYRPSGLHCLSRTPERTIFSESGTFRQRLHLWGSVFGKERSYSKSF